MHGAIFCFKVVLMKCIMCKLFFVCSLFFQKDANVLDSISNMKDVVSL